MLTWLENNWLRIIGLLLVLALLAFVGLLFYSRLTLGFWPDWTGLGDYTDPSGEFHPAKTLWDWLELLIIPIVLGLGAAWLERSERRSDRLLAEAKRENDLEIARETRQEAELDNFIETMTEMLLKEKLKTEPTDEVKDVARIRTLATLQRLDGDRKRILMQLLWESDLIKIDNLHDEPIIKLFGADLEKASLGGTNLSKSDLESTMLNAANLRSANLQDAKLKKAILTGASLFMANLSNAHLREADLRDADLRGADLRGAHLLGADMRGANLNPISIRDVIKSNLEFYNELENLGADSLNYLIHVEFENATMPDGTIYSISTDLTKFTNPKTEETPEEPPE